MPTLERLVAAPAWTHLLAGVVCFLGLSWAEMAGQCSTYDEGGHLSAAAAALFHKDYRLLPEQPPLGRRIGALALLGSDAKLPLDRPSWREADYWTFGFEFLYRSGNDPDRLLGRARWAMLFWGVLLVGSVFAVARDLFGPAGGLAVLVVAAFNPNLIAHAHLVTTDVPVAAMIFLAVVAYHRWLEQNTFLRAAAAGVLVAGAVCVKFNALILAPLLAVLTVVAAALRKKPLRELGREAIRRAGPFLLLVAAAVAVVWGAYGFRFAASPDGYSMMRQADVGTKGLAATFFRWALDHRLFPEAFCMGIIRLGWYFHVGHYEFAMGGFESMGRWWFFPLSFLVKTPVAVMGILAVGAVVGFRKARLDPAPGLPYLLGAMFLWGSALFSTLNLGIRHLLPAFPFMFLAAGAAIGSGAPRLRILAPALVAVSVLETVAAAPYFLPYYNLPAAVCADRHKVFVDSNLDIGQDLRRLKRTVDARGIRTLKLAYFGTASPRHEGLDHEWLQSVNLYVKNEPGWKAAESLAVGDWLAISATTLAYGRGDPSRGYETRNRYAEIVEGQEFVESVGHSIRLYRIRRPVDVR